MNKRVITVELVYASEDEITPASLMNLESDIRSLTHVHQATAEFLGVPDGTTEKTKAQDSIRMRDVQGSALALSKDPYMIGVYNGLELAASILQDRQPEFKTRDKDQVNIFAGRPEGARGKHSV